MSNKSLCKAKAAKNDEFYTQYYDIEREINAYLEFDPNVFRGKTVLLPCDDPEWSNFTLYFAQHFQTLGLKKLISTSYAPESKKYKTPYQPSLFEQDAPQFDANKTSVRGKIFVLDHDIDGDGRIDFHDLEWRYLDGDGDFRSDEVTRMRDEADIIVTNPPFSLFREFLAWIVEANKKFAVIGYITAVCYLNIFPLIKENKIWLGATDINLFITPHMETRRLNNVYWFTNLDHARRPQPLVLRTMQDNLRFSKHKKLKGKQVYDRYDNYDAINVPFTDSIPSDYDGIMGVPISFLDKYCPEQFELISVSGRSMYGYKPHPEPSINGVETFRRIFIRHRRHSALAPHTS